MTAYLITMSVLLGISALGKMIWVSTDKFPVRTKKMEIWDIFINIILIVWGINLLII